MRISDANLPYHSIVWFGVDPVGNVIAFFSLGEGHIPEFVKKSEEETMALFHYFYGHADWDFSKAFSFQTRLDKAIFVNQGLFVCVADDPYDGDKYRVVAQGTTPLSVNDLPGSIREMLITHQIPVNADRCNEIILKG